MVERDLAQRYAVSRVPLREALQRLVREGLVEVSKQRGASVRGLSEQDVLEIYDLRMMLEGEAMARSVAKLDAAGLSALDSVHAQLGQAITASEQGALDRQFHALLYAPCGQTRLLKTLWELRGEMERYERLQSRLLVNTAFFQAEHAAILAACKVGDAEKACAEVRRHLTSAKQVVLRAINGKDGVSAV
ncbi:GntR family transcriptional regulator [Hydrogenophaga soli]